jgi:hypothetical protein
MSSRRWILPYRILNVKHDKKYFKACTNVHFLDLIMEHLLNIKSMLHQNYYSYAFLLSKLFYKRAKFSNCFRPLLVQCPRDLKLPTDSSFSSLRWGDFPGNRLMCRTAVFILRVRGQLYWSQSTVYLPWGITILSEWQL